MEQADRGFSLGAADYLVKPILEEDLVSALNRLNKDGTIHEVLVIDDDPNDLRLIEDHELDEGSVLRAIASRHESRTSLPLHLLGQRFGVLAGAPAYDAERLPIGLPEVLKTAPRERLLEFYQAWYRPDNMAVVVVGDIPVAVAEALVFASKAGADPARVRSALMGGFASSRILEVHGERMVKRTFDPGFRINLHQKDLNLALTTARQLGMSLPSTAVAQELFNACVAHGGAGWDHSGMVRALEILANHEIGQ